jgi:hypothetical protein
MHLGKRREPPEDPQGAGDVEVHALSELSKGLRRGVHVAHAAQVCCVVEEEGPEGCIRRHSKASQQTKSQLQGRNRAVPVGGVTVTRKRHLAYLDDSMCGVVLCQPETLQSAAEPISACQ